MSQEDNHSTELFNYELLINLLKYEYIEYHYRDEKKLETKSKDLNFVFKNSENLDTFLKKIKYKETKCNIIYLKVINLDDINNDDNLFKDIETIWDDYIIHTEENNSNVYKYKHNKNINIQIRFKLNEQTPIIEDKIEKFKDIINTINFLDILYNEHIRELFFYFNSLGKKDLIDDDDKTYEMFEKKLSYASKFYFQKENILEIIKKQEYNLKEWNDFNINLFEEIFEINEIFNLLSDSAKAIFKTEEKYNKIWLNIDNYLNSNNPKFNDIINVLDNYKKIFDLDDTENSKLAKKIIQIYNFINKQEIISSNNEMVIENVVFTSIYLMKLLEPISNNEESSYLTKVINNELNYDFNIINGFNLLNEKEFLNFRNNGFNLLEVCKDINCFKYDENTETIINNAIFKIIAKHKNEKGKQ